jgi:hypothetical protein
METIYWTMKNGQKINVDDMDENHLRNTLKLIIRTAEAKAKAKQIAESKFRLRGDIAQHHVETMEDQDYFDECAADFEFWKY